MNKKRRNTIVIVAFALAAIAGVTLYLSQPRLTLPTDSPVQISRFLATDQFVSLPADQKRAYIDRLEKLTFEQRVQVAKEANLSPEQAKLAYKNAFRVAAQKRIDTYFAIADTEKRKAYLDALIDEYEKEQKFQKREPPTLAQIKAQLESMPPGQRARAAEFMGAFSQRRIVRGLGIFQ